jgi:hypothetical protein
LNSPLIRLLQSHFFVAICIDAAIMEVPTMPARNSGMKLDAPPRIRRYGPASFASVEKHGSTVSLEK